MIHVSQGHHHGIGLEIFLKSFLCLDRQFQKKIVLHCSKIHLIDTLQTISVDYQFSSGYLILNNKQLRIQEIGEEKSTLRSLESALAAINPDDYLITLPSSKEQFSPFKGHTDYFRSKHNQTITMNFVSSNMNVLLLTDHIPLRSVASSITEELIINSIKTTVINIKPLREVVEVLIAGINPHCGEDGLLGSEDEVLYKSISKLSQIFPRIKFSGVFSADTIHLKHTGKQQLFVFPFHDQGLTCFKSLNGLTGINLSLGLPFMRMSVDHGTAFELYGKNQGNYNGLLNLFMEIKKAIK